MSEYTDINDAIRQFPRRKARTLRFGCGAPRSARVVGDGSRALFLRSDGPEDTVTALWMSGFDKAGEPREIALADPRVLLADADDEDVPAEEKARRERAREGGSGIVSYSVDAAGERVVFTINGRLFLTQVPATVDADDDTAAGTRQLAAAAMDSDPSAFTPVLNPRISPDGRHVMYTTGTRLVVVSIADDTDDHIAAIADVDARNAAAADAPWRIGLAEFAAGEEMDRYDGFWWAPDSRGVLYETYDTTPEPMWYIADPANPDHPVPGTRYPRALTRNVDAYLTRAALAFDEDGRCTGVEASADVAWDREAYEYVAAVSWTGGHEPLVLVQNRRQTRDRVLAVAADGSVRVLEEHANDQWLDLVGGTPAYTPDGRLVCALNDMDADTNRLTVDGRAFTPVGLNVREVLDVTDDDVLCVVQRDPALLPDVPAVWADTADGHDARSFDVVAIAYDGSWSPETAEPGVWTMSRGERGNVVAGRMMASPRTRVSHCVDVTDMVVADDGEPVGQSWAVAVLSDDSAEPGFAPNVTFTRMGEHALHTAIIAPSESSPYAHAASLPVLMKPYGGPGAQQVVASQAYYWDAQWWADQGFLVVTADGRGTTGRGPKWDREIFEDMKDVTLADQVEAVHALPDAVASLNDAFAALGETRRIPTPDLDHVCMIGWSYGGFLSALAVLDAPDVFHAACAGAPPTDWTLYDTHYTERYLGLDPETYRRNSIVEDAPNLRRPLMLIHGFADDNVTIAHSLRLSQALMAAGRQHTFLPLTGITHMTNDETVAENLLVLQRDFLYDALGMR